MGIKFICILTSSRKILILIFFRDDAPEKDADVDANEAKEGDAQGYVLYWMIPF